VAATLEHVHEADDVAVHVGVRILQRVAHPGLRREVDDTLELLFCEQRSHALAVGDIELDEAETCVRLQSRQAVELELDVVVVVEVVQADHFVTAREQAQRRGHADEAGSAGQEDLHGRVSAEVAA
jgi:hypothetical protein